MSCEAFAGDLDAWLAGDLATADRIGRHVAQCATCGGEWASVRTIGGMGSDDDSVADVASVTRARDRLRTALDRAGHPPIRFGVLSSPVGQLFVGVTEQGVCDVTFGQTSERRYRERLLSRSPEVRRDDEGVAEIRAQLEAYFAGELTRFALAVDLRQVTPFTQKVLRAARAIEFGQVTSYGRLATRIGSPGASRAVGGALGRNPIPIIIPCHRVLAAGGRLGGFTGGLGTKRTLLRHEGYTLQSQTGALFDE
jgi:methylated-DNA-[protein]-cysteine S-methyltransferase